MPHPGEHLRLCPLLCNRRAKTKKKKGPSEEQIKAPEKNTISDEEIAKLSGAEFKTLEISMLTEMVEYGCKIEGKDKAMKNEIKENAQGTNSDGKETGLKSTVWTRRKK